MVVRTEAASFSLERGERAGGGELDPRYCDVIVARWEAFTGLEASRA